MDTPDDRSTRIGRRRGQDGEVGNREAAAPDDTSESSSTATRLGARRSGAASPETPDPSGDTQLGARRRATDEASPEPTPTPSGDTQLGARRRAAGEDPPAPTPAGEGTALGARPRTSDAASPPDEVVRFGPGVPAREPTAPTWRGSSTTSGTRTRARRRKRPYIGALITLALLAGVIAFLLLRQSNPLVVESVRVEAPSAAGRCDSVVDVVGTVTTNGRGGTLQYQWLRSDGETTAVLTQSVSDGTPTTQVHLQWSVSGRGRFPAQAVLRVLAPTPLESAGGFTYSCP